MKIKLFSKLVFVTLSMSGLQNPAFAQEQKLINATKFFPFLDKLLSLPPSDRDGLIVNYYANIDGKPPQNVFLVHNGQKTKMNFASDGKVLNLPNLETLRSGQIEYLGKKGTKNTIGFSGEPRINLAQKIDTAQIKNSIADLKACMKIAGPFSVFIPKIKSVAFKGVKSGNAILPDGSKIPLKTNNDGIFFTPEDNKLKNAIYVEFNTVPTSATYTK